VKPGCCSINFSELANGLRIEIVGEGMKEKMKAMMARCCCATHNTTDTEKEETCCSQDEVKK
jgi:hypothetical protein